MVLSLPDFRILYWAFRGFVGKIKGAVQARNVGAFGFGSRWYGGEIHYSKRLEIGEYVYLGPGLTVYAYGGVVIGDGTVFGPNVTMHTRNHEFEFASTMPYGTQYVERPIRIGKGVWIGDSVVFLPGAKVGDGAVIGAGSVVRGVIPSYALAYGNPANVVRMRKDEDAARRLIEEGKYYLKVKRAFT